jgi:UDP-N-acetylmuramate--alanine ligase
MYNKKAHIHFVGIGGIGMSGIATILKYQGYTISGCDIDMEQKSIAMLAEIGCTVFSGNNTPQCHDPSIDILVYSTMIPTNNPELHAAQQRGIPTIPRALMLAELMRTKYSVAISGAHGKTTTTSLIAHILIEAAFDPTVIIGGHLTTISHNARIGNGDFLVAEADESDRSFLHLYATLAVVTNIDLEHLETYQNIEDIKQTFKQFLMNLPFYGAAILCADDEHIQSLLPMPTIKTILYGLSPRADWYATNIDLQPHYSTFTLHHKDYEEPIGHVTLNMPGKHNVLNGLAAIALAQELEVPMPSIIRSLQTFQGVDRRFSYRGTFQGAELFDDYGHHPREIECTLQVAQRRAKKNLTVVFQPHRYIRTHKLWDNFIETFLQSTIDHLIITDLHSAGETPIPGVSGKQFAQALKNHLPRFRVSYVPLESDFAAIKTILSKETKPDDLILLLGAGKINRLVKVLV